MKELIKQLSIEQKALKQQRKTGTYTITAWDRFDNAILPEVAVVANNAAYQVQCNKLKITAAFNLYNEKRGVAYRHNVPDHLKRQYGKIIVALNNEVNALEKQ